MEKKIHHGRNIMRFRQMRGLKQDAFASLLGDDWNQMKVSRLEAKEEVEANILEQVAKALNMPVEAVANFDEEANVFNIQNNYEGSISDSARVSHTNNYHSCSFNPLDKYVEAVDEIKRLYEALLKVEREKNALLERMLQERK
jgi:transcriptional regulator with XRE-family HTH domain